MKPFYCFFEESASSRSSGMLAIPQLQGEQNAYIPYIYAKEWVQRVSGSLSLLLCDYVSMKSYLKSLKVAFIRPMFCKFQGLAGKAWPG